MFWASIGKGIRASMLRHVFEAWLPRAKPLIAKSGYGRLGPCLGVSDRMKKASIVVGDYYGENRLFLKDDPKINRDNCLAFFQHLREALGRKGFALSTSDIHATSESDLIFYNEMPRRLPPADQKHRSHLFIFESELIRPDNWSSASHRAFERVFTWHDDLIGTENYRGLRFSHDFPEVIERVPFVQRKLATLIAGNKRVSHPWELYSQRLNTITWFEANHPETFDYYGLGWDSYDLGNRTLNKVVKKSGIQKMFPPKKGVCCRGPVDVKKDTLKNYKFAICYENAKEIPGYITEKIFDCFFAGVVPVYWGAPNISTHIPESCFVARTAFDSHEDMFTFLTSMSADEHASYLDAIESYLQSDRGQEYSAKHNAESVVNDVLS